jgi:hypothetical protein
MRRRHPSHGTAVLPTTVEFSAAVEPSLVSTKNGKSRIVCGLYLKELLVSENYLLDTPRRPSPARRNRIY